MTCMMLTIIVTHTGGCAFEIPFTSVFKHIPYHAHRWICSDGEPASACVSQAYQMESAQAMIDWLEANGHQAVVTSIRTPTQDQ